MKNISRFCGLYKIEVKTEIGGGGSKSLSFFVQELKIDTSEQSHCNISCAESYFFETEIQIWAGFGPSGQFRYNDFLVLLINISRRS